MANYAVISERKARLYAAAGCRRHWELFADKDIFHAVEVAERHADGLVTKEQRQAAFDRLDQIITGFGQNHQVCGEMRSRMQAAKAASEATNEAPVASDGHDWGRIWTAYSHVVEAAFPIADLENHDKIATELAWYADLARDVFGNPFRPVPVAPALRTPTVVSLASAAYDERQLPNGELEWDRLAVLSDALEEAAATGDLIDHLRSSDPPRPRMLGRRLVSRPELSTRPGFRWSQGRRRADGNVGIVRVVRSVEANRAWHPSICRMISDLFWWRAPLWSTPRQGVTQELLH